MNRCPVSGKWQARANVRNWVELDLRSLRKPQGTGEGADGVTTILAHEAGDAALPTTRALRLQVAGGAIRRTASVDADLAARLVPQ